jgi:hypothetical protein
MIQYEVKFDIKNPDLLDKQVAVTISDSIKKKLSSFEKDAKEFKGKVIINIPADFRKPQIEIQGLPKDMIQKMKKCI